MQQSLLLSFCRYCLFVRGQCIRVSPTLFRVTTLFSHQRERSGQCPVHSAVAVLPRRQRLEEIRSLRDLCPRDNTTKFPRSALAFSRNERGTQPSDCSGSVLFRTRQSIYRFPKHIRSRSFSEPNGHHGRGRGKAPFFFSSSLRSKKRKRTQPFPRGQFAPSATHTASLHFSSIAPSVCHLSDTFLCPEETPRSQKAELRELLFQFVTHKLPPPQERACLSFLLSPFPGSHPKRNDNPRKQRRARFPHVYFLLSFRSCHRKDLIRSFLRLALGGLAST